MVCFFEQEEEIKKGYARCRGTAKKRKLLVPGHPQDMKQAPKMGYKLRRIESCCVTHFIWRGTIRQLFNQTFMAAITRYRNMQPMAGGVLDQSANWGELVCHARNEIEGLYQLTARRE